MRVGAVQLPASELIGCRIPQDSPAPAPCKRTTLDRAASATWHQSLQTQKTDSRSHRKTRRSALLVTGVTRPSFLAYPSEPLSEMHATDAI